MDDGDIFPVAAAVEVATVALHQLAGIDNHQSSDVAQGLLDGLFVQHVVPSTTFRTYGAVLL